MAYGAWLAGQLGAPSVARRGALYVGVRLRDETDRTHLNGRAALAPAHAPARCVTISRVRDASAHHTTRVVHTIVAGSARVD